MRRIVGGLALLAAVLAAAGCGTGGVSRNGDASRGKQIFSQKCASCHVLADAGATGNVGPNLDDAFGYDRKQGFQQSTFQQVVDKQVRYAEPPMPNADQLFPSCKHGLTQDAQKAAGCSADRFRDVRDVAFYVASVAGKGPLGGVPANASPGAQAQAPAGGGQNVAAQGKEIFTQNCASCHTLKDAGAKGTIGPNLDQLKPPPEIVQHQVINGGSVMPAFKGKLSDEQIKAVSAYVGSVAGK